MELLAPGGSLEAIAAALQHGADAVYFGVGTLNARARARNLDELQLAGVVAAIHAAGARAYVTLNLPVNTANRSETARLLARSHLDGADAVIARDLRLMRAARACCPGLEVHASTQAGVATPERARAVREEGCTRAVLARELSSAGIAAIRTAAPDLELEVFGFGAQCFAVSGLCLLGEAITPGRSGNFGACAQACRLPYWDAQGRLLGHCLSMKDLDLTPRLAELAGLGVRSLKIEGRLKSPAWVGCVTHWLRLALDRDPPGLDAEERAAFQREVSVLFARPRTSAFFDGHTDSAKLIDPGDPGQRGLEVLDFKTESHGRGRAVRFRTPVELSLRDGLLLHLEPGADPVPWGVRSLLDGQGRAAGRIPAGAEALVPFDLQGRVARLAIHSCDAVRRRYEPASPLSMTQDQAQVTRIAAARLQEGRLSLTLARGRFHMEHDAAVVTRPATGEGFGPGTAGRILGDSVTPAPGLYVNPRDLKQVRREALARFESACQAALRELTARIEATLAADPRPDAAPDAELLTRGPAAVSRVTGLPAGVIRTSSGKGFEVKQTANGCVLIWKA